MTSATEAKKYGAGRTYKSFDAVRMSEKILSGSAILYRVEERIPAATEVPTPCLLPSEEIM